MIKGGTLSVRTWGSLLLPLLLAEGALGVASVGAGSAPTSPLLLAHVGLGVVVVAVALTAFVATRWIPSSRALWSVRLTSLCVALTGTTGAAFLFVGTSQGLDVDRVLGLLDLLGAASMIVWGGVRATPRAPSETGESAGHSLRRRPH